MSTKIKITGKDILNSIPGDQLFDLAIMKLLMEGQDWREYASLFPRRAFEMSIALREEREQHDPS